MARNRTGLAPWSLAREAGIESATVDGRIEVPQYVQPTLNTGFVDEKGDWKGAKSNDKVFIAMEIHESIANGGELLAPNANADGTWPLDMTGYSDIAFAIKPSRGGNCAITTVMGTGSFANLSPVNEGTQIVIANQFHSPPDLEYLFNDSAQALTADVWNIFIIQQAAKGQKLLQFKITNNAGGVSTIETAFMRLV